MITEVKHLELYQSSFGEWQNIVMNTKMEEMPVLVRSLKSRTLRLTNHQLGITFWWVAEYCYEYQDKNASYIVQSLKSSTMGFTSYLLGITF